MTKIKLSILAVLFSVFGIAINAGAVPQTVNFSDYPDYIPSVYDMDSAASSWFYTNYGITFDHVYMYTDTRDTFDGLGLSVGWASEMYTNVTGFIYFADTTDYVGIDCWSQAYGGTYSVYNSANELLDSLVIGVESGIYTLTGTNISYMTFTGTGGYLNISTLSYDYDGTTDGVNRDTSPVPEPTTMLLFAAGIIGLTGIKRQKKVTNA